MPPSLRSLVPGPFARALAVGLVLASLAACTLPAEILVPGPGSTGASPGAPLADAGTAEPPAACTPSSAAGWTPTWVPPTGASQGACAPQDLAELYAACFGADATGDTCSAYESGNSTCASCVLSASTDGSWGPVVVFAGATAVNQPGCLALVDPGAAACAQAAESQTECEHALCDASCPVSDAASFDAWQACAAQADAGACAGYDGACLDAVLAADAGGAECGGADFPTAFADVATVFCGGGS